MDENGETKQKWETRTSYQEALKRKAEIESQKSSNSFLPPTNQNIAEFLSDFVSLYGEKRWGVSMYDSQNSLIANYINPIIGDMKVQDITTRVVKSFEKLREKAGLPKVVFHSLRHSSTTYKLKLNHGDLKATQGDTGHAQVDMITQVYAHILDEDRKINAQKFESAFYANPDLRSVRPPEEPKEPAPATLDLEALVEQLRNSPELANTLAALLASAPSEK